MVEAKRPDLRLVTPEFLRSRAKTLARRLDIDRLTAKLEGGVYWGRKRIRAAEALSHLRAKEPLYTPRPERVEITRDF